MYSLLLRFDDDLAREAREIGCTCGGRLDVADYPRKPRGGPEGLDDNYNRRRSFCCAVDGCRKRCTPPSVRFLGRRVYFAAVNVLVAAMLHGPTRRRVSELAALLGVNRRTLARWRRWWTAVFAASRFWRGAKARFASDIDEAEIPRSLFMAVGDVDEATLIAILRFLAPISTNPWLEASAA